MIFWFHSYVLRPLLPISSPRDATYLFQHASRGTSDIEYVSYRQVWFVLNVYPKASAASVWNFQLMHSLRRIAAIPREHSSRIYISIRICVRRVTYVFHDNFDLAILTRPDYLRTYFRKFDPLPTGEMSR